MMRKLIFLALGGLLASGAQACIPNSGAFLYNDPHEGPSQRLKCRTVDGKHVCHSFAEWARIDHAKKTTEPSSMQVTNEAGR